jgi:hypothetical protein
MAVENAPAHERIWIEDIYQNVFCGSSQGTRKQADGIVAVWRKMFARPSAGGERMGLGGRQLDLPRKCGNGEVIDVHRASPEAAAVAATPPAPPARPETLQGNTLGFGLRDAGATK